MSGAYVRRYPALSLMTEYHAIMAKRSAEHFGRRFMLNPNGAIVSRPIHDLPDEWQNQPPDDVRHWHDWRLCQTIARENPLPSGFDDDWLSEPEPVPLRVLTTMSSEPNLWELLRIAKSNVPVAILMAWSAAFVAVISLIVYSITYLLH